MPKHLYRIIYACFLLIVIASIVLVQPGLAANPVSAPPFEQGTPEPGDIRYGYNSETGKLSFVGGGRGQPLIKMGEIGAQSVEAAGMTVIRRYAGQFGVQDPTRNLRLERKQHEVNGSTLRYQQEYRGVPVVGGEIVVNSDEIGNVLSLNGEVSPDLALPSVTPSISAEAARQIAVAGMQAWHGIAPDNASSTDPELWIYDERIFKESSSPVRLVWRMELSPIDFTQPVHEFVLVDAKTGEIALHFNQVDTSWHLQAEEPAPTPTTQPTLEPAPTEIPTIEPSPTESPTPEPTPTETPTPEPTPTDLPTQEPEPQNLPGEDTNGSGDGMIESNISRYLSTNGNDSNDCATPQTACRTFARTASQSSSGTTLYVSDGSYSIQGKYTISYSSFHITGGWNSSFSEQNTETTFIGSGSTSGFIVNAVNIKLSKLKLSNFTTSISVNDAMSAEIDDVIVINNIYPYGGSYPIYNGGNITISNSAIVRSNNGILNRGTATIVNSTIGNNNSGVSNEGTIVLHHVTIANNVYSPINNTGNITIKNSIIFGNTDCSGVIVSGGYNVMDKCSTLQPQPTDLIGANPRIGPLVRDKYYPLLSTSLAVNHIPENCSDCPAKDIRGASRPFNARFDSGAYEYYEPGAPAVILPFDGNQQATGSNRVFHKSISALVLDNIGSPVPGITVAFKTPTSGPSAVFHTTGHNQIGVVTGMDGTANPGGMTANGMRGYVPMSISVTSNVTAVYGLYIIDLFVNPAGSDTNNDCMDKTKPCQTLSYAVSKAVPGISILLSGGIHQIATVYIQVENILISGDWDQGFEKQNSITILDGIDKNHFRFIEVRSSPTIITNITFRNIQSAVIVKPKVTAMIQNSAFIDNNRGVKIEDSASVTIKNSTFSGNTNGIDNEAGNVTVTSSTITNNFSYGIYNLGYDRGGITISSSIVALNKSNCYTYRSSFQSQGYNLFGSDCTGGTNDRIVNDPVVGSLFRDRYLPLLPSSPAVDQIPPSIGSACPAKDVRGFSRPAGEKCDIGAYEYAIPGTAAGMYLQNGNAQTAGTNRIYATPLRVNVYDSFGTPVSGIAITYTAPDSGPSGIFVQGGTRTVIVYSDGNGIAAAELRANNIIGNFSLTASLTGTGITVPFSLSILDFYFSPAGTDTNNDCRNPSMPCKSMSYINTVTRGAGVLLTTGDYWVTGNMSLSKAHLTISGGWNNDFTKQIGYAYIRGVNYKYEINQPNTTIENIVFLEMQEITTSNSVTFINSASVNNTIGIRNSGLLTLINTTISSNRSVGLSNSGTATVINSTLVGNQISAINQTLSSASITLQNSIIGSHQLCDIIDGSFQSKGNNIINPDCAKQVSKINSDSVGDARVSELINKAYHALISGSPAIDAIDPAAPGAYCPATDQRGVTRPNGDRCDIGAYEYTIPGQAAAFSVRSGSHQIIGLLQEPMVPLEVQVTDALGVPVAGIQVTFTAASSGAGGSFNGSLTSSVKTDASGIAAGKGYRTNNISGANLILVSSPGLSTLAIMLTNSDGFYVSVNTGSDTSNDCRSSAAPCKTISAAVSKATVSGTILIAQGKYDASSTTIAKNLYLSGGWNTDFSEQSGITLSQSSSARHFTVYPTAVLSIDRMEFVGGNPMIANSGTLRITNSSFRKGIVAISNYGVLSLTNVSIYSIVSTNDYNNAAIVNSNGVIQLTNVTIANNISTVRNWTSYAPITGAGIHNFSGAVLIKNSILTGNRSTRGFECSGKITSLGNNILGISEGCQWSPADGDRIGTLRKSVDAGLLEIPLNESGPFVRLLLTGSPAIDAADPSACPTHDQRGQPRPSGTSCDIGAYEGSTDGIPGAFVIIYDGDRSSDIPGQYKCSSPTASCTNGSNLDADLAYTYAAGFLKFLYEQHDRNSYDGSGSPLIQTVNYGYDFQNAFWTDNGYQVVFGKGFARADDVLAHEITHGFTRTTSNLFYFYQSGAINESLSDLWGEYYDQSNAMGKDSAADKWLIGEDLAFRIFRSMKNPPAYKDPDKMTSTYYYTGPDDNGGVHRNSGVNNKAIFLMVDGGSFNNRTVRALGWEKTAAVYYYAQTRLLTSASDYKDLYYALDQACIALIDAEKGITPDDCKQVISAVNAVQMNKTPVSDYNPEAAYCPTNMTRYPTDLYFEDFENGTSNWSFGAKVGNPHWGITPGKYDYEYATSGRYALYGDDYDNTKEDWNQRSDSYAEMNEGIEVPVGSATMLHFNHAFGFEWITYNGVNYHFDGGVVEYTIDNGASWKDAKAIFSAGRNYTGSIYSATYSGNNPLRGRSAFVRDSRGYVSTRYNLTPLAGKTVRFRWRLGTDNEYYRFGWVVDDVRFYKCVGNPGTPALVSPATGSLTTNYQPKLDWKDAANFYRYELQIALDSAFSNIYFTDANLIRSEYQFTSDLPSNTRYYWRVRTINEIDQVSTWSSTRSFRTALLPPEIITPAAGSVPDSLRPTFQWSSSPDAVSYTLIVSAYANYSSPLINTIVKDTSYQPPRNLPINKKLYWRVRANGANTSAWRSGSFTNPYPSPAPVLTSPAHNTRIYIYTPTLTWKASIPAKGAPSLAFYHIQVDNDADFSSPLFEEKEWSSTSYTLPSDLLHNQRFYWRVRAINTSGQFAWWSGRTFITALRPPEIISPAPGSVPDSLRPTFIWESSPDATSYTIVISSYANFSSPLINTTVQDTGYTPTKNLPANKKLHWRVRANGANPSAWTKSNFTSPAPLPAPAIVAPVNAQRMKTLSPELKWKPTTSPTFAYYHLQVSTSADFASPLLYEEQNYLAASFQIPDELQTDRKYYWRVKSVNTSEQFAWWSSAFFIIPIPSPELISPEPGELIAEPKPAFDWNDVPSADSYSIAVSTYSNFSSLLINKKVTGSEYTSLKVLPRGRTIYWRVRAHGTTGAGEWSPVQKFKIQ